VNRDFEAIPIGELMEHVAAPTPSPGGGSLAALSVGLAASLVAMVARSSHASWPDAGGVAAQALELAARCPGLARDDAVVWEEAFEELRVAAANGGVGGNGNLPALLDLSAALPLEIAEIGSDVTVLASIAARLGDGSLRADAASAAVLAHSGTRVAAHLVACNLGVPEGDERRERAGTAERRARMAMADALAAGP
jgi:formiminotetrahydrofolate cyclodeaminase